LLFAVRFILEFFKEPEGDLLLGIISKTQVLSLPFIIIGFITFVYFQRKKVAE
jgi:prolipoprotein diacylglyceryltransferase